MHSVSSFLTPGPDTRINTIVRRRPEHVNGTWLQIRRPNRAGGRSRLVTSKRGHTDHMAREADLPTTGDCRPPGCRDGFVDLVGPSSRGQRAWQLPDDLWGTLLAAQRLLHLDLSPPCTRDPPVWWRHQVPP